MVRTCRIVFLVWWNDSAERFCHTRVEVSTRHATRLVKSGLAMNTLDEAIFQIGRLRRLMAHGESKDHFINPVKVRG